MRHAFSAITALYILTATAEAKQPYEGSWAATPKNCTEPNDGNVRITSRNYFEHGGSCGIRKVNKSAEHWVLDLSCEGEGEKWAKKVILIPLGNRLTIGTSGSALVRCKSGLQPPNWPAAD